MLVLPENVANLGLLFQGAIRFPERVRVCQGHVCHRQRLVATCQAYHHRYAPSPEEQVSTIETIATK